MEEVEKSTYQVLCQPTNRYGPIQVRTRQPFEIEIVLSNRIISGTSQVINDPNDRTYDRESRGLNNKASKLCHGR